MTLLSTAYFPPIIWMAILAKNETITIDLHETYSKQSYRNRFEIATANGKMALSVPVKKPDGNHTITKNILVDYSENWQQVHWRSIKAAYQSSPYFIYYQDEIEVLFNIKYDTLFQMNQTIIEKLAAIIGIQGKTEFSSDFMPLNTHKQDYRFNIHPKYPSTINTPEYDQVFEEKTGFSPNLSFLDLIFNLGPESILYLRELKINSNKTQTS